MESMGSSTLVLPGISYLDRRKCIKIANYCRPPYKWSEKAQGTMFFAFREFVPLPIPKFPHPVCW